MSASSYMDPLKADGQQACFCCYDLLLLLPGIDLGRLCRLQFWPGWRLWWGWLRVSHVASRRPCQPSGQCNMDTHGAAMTLSISRQAFCQSFRNVTLTPAAFQSTFFKVGTIHNVVVYSRRVIGRGIDRQRRTRRCNVVQNGWEKPRQFHCAALNLH